MLKYKYKYMYMALMRANYLPLSCCITSVPVHVYMYITFSSLAVCITHCHDRSANAYSIENRTLHSMSTFVAAAVNSYCISCVSSPTG